jgi:hypothetical protein
MSMQMDIGYYLQLCQTCDQALFATDEVDRTRVR